MTLSSRLAAMPRRWEFTRRLLRPFETWADASANPALLPEIPPGLRRQRRRTANHFFSVSKPRSIDSAIAL